MDALVRLENNCKETGGYRYVHGRLRLDYYDVILVQNRHRQQNANEGKTQQSSN